MDQKKYKHGFTLGKFMPPHTGHLHLIAEAMKHVDHLRVLVCSIERETIPGKVRFEWMKELHAGVDITIIHVTDEVPSYPHEHSGFWSIWTKLLRQYIHPETEVFFSGESYGDDVARHLNIRHVCIDRMQSNISISATAIRERPLLHWDHIPRQVRPYFVRRVVLTGPESTGKTTLARLLAEHFHTNWVEEYGREHFVKVQGKLTLNDISVIAQTQMLNEEAAAKTSDKLLFCDTDLIVTQVWSEIYFKECPSWIMEENTKNKYHLFLLLDIDVTWVDDGTREFPHLREFHFQKLRDELDKRGFPYRVVSGNFAERMSKAVEIVKSFFE